LECDLKSQLEVRALVVKSINGSPRGEITEAHSKMLNGATINHLKAKWDYMENVNMELREARGGLRFISNSAKKARGRDNPYRRTIR
jgi:hypothetical protein